MNRKATKPNEATGAQRVPPQAVDVEQAVLGAMLLEREAIGNAIEIIDEYCFYRDDHQKIYSAVVDLYDQNQPVDILTLTEELGKRKQLEEVGGRLYLIELTEGVATSANIEYHCRIILERATLRKLIEVSTDIVSRCYEQEEDADLLLDSAEQKIFDISERRIKPSFTPLGEILPHTFETIDEYVKRGGMITGVATGFVELDTLTGGLQNSDLIVVAGRPSMGKTSFCLCIAEHVAIEENIPVGVFSLEMAKAQLAQRMLCSRARFSTHQMRLGRLSDEEYSKLAIAVGPLAEAKIFLDDSPILGILQLRAKARRLKAKENIGLVIVDYLQLMQGPKRTESRQQEISVISRSLKALAKELNVPVIAISQLSRKAEDRVDKKPQLADLRESGAIEQDADLVLLVYRPEFYNIKEFKGFRGKRVTSTEGIAEIMVAKHRNGPTGEVMLAFVKDYARFENLSYVEAEPPF